MLRVVPAEDRALKPIDLPGATVQVSDPIIGKDDCLSAGFTEYVAPSRLEWTFDYNEVFYVIDGALQVEDLEGSTHTFGPGDLGYIEKGTRAVITVEHRASLVHVTQPAWREP